MPKTHYSASELATMRLPTLPGTTQGVTLRAKRDGWAKRERSASGGGYEYPVESLPAQAQAELKRRQTKDVLALAPTTAIALRPSSAVAISEANATGRQRQIADARRGVIAAIDAVMARTGYPRMRAAQALIDSARLGDASAQIMRQLELARDGRGRSSPDGLPSVRSLLRFIERAEGGSLVPTVPQRDMAVPAWAPLFMEFFQRPEKPSVQHAYERFAVAWSAEPQRMVPSVHQVRRFLEKVGHVSREVGRMGPRELKTLQPFKRRNFAELLPCDIYSADGHTLDAEVQHPKHGRPFRPEITSVIDIATRRVVGWSTTLAESSLAVLNAFRRAVETGGVPNIFYVDNGSGYVNEMMQDVATGLMARLGSTMVHSLPYNSQERGVIERLHRTLWVKAAKELPGFMGEDMDREARQKMHKITRKAIKLREAGETAAMPLMSWAAFLEFCEQKVAAYNDRPHRSLPQIVVAGVKRHMAPNEMWAQKVAAGFEAHMLSDAERALIWRPQEMRTVQRCEINLYNNRYFAPELEEWHGAQLRVAYDPHDASKVWIFDDDERFVCIAELNGNASPYMPKSMIERADEKRAIGRERRLQSHLDEVQQELRGVRVIEQPDEVRIGMRVLSRDELNAGLVEIAQEPEQIAAPAAPAPHEQSDAPADEFLVPRTAAERFELFEKLSAAAEISADALSWMRSYQTSGEYRGLAALKKSALTCDRKSA